jgi:transposase
VNLSVSFLEDAPKTMRLPEFARRAGVHYRTAKEWVYGTNRKGRKPKKGWLPHGKIGGRVVIVRDEAKTALLMRSPGNI